MKLLKKVGATSEIWQIFLQDSSSTTGAGLTGLTSASSGLTAYYHRDTDTTATAISLVTMTVGTFTSSGFKEIDSTNMPGWYQFCPPNAALASGAKSCAFHIKGATNLAPLPIECQLVAFDPDDAVHLGLSCLPNTACTTNASLITSGTGTDQLSVTSGRVDNGKWLGTTIATPATAGIPDVNTKNINNVAAATPGASGGIIINGSNSGAVTLAGLTLAGANASGGSPAAAGLTITGGAATTTAGGTSGAGILVTGGAGAASTNGAAAGVSITAGGTTTVSGNDGFTATGTGNGNGVTFAHAGSGVDLNATTSPPLNVNATKINGVSTSSVTTINANLGMTQPVNFTGTGASALVKSDMVDVAGAAVSTSSAQIGVNVVTYPGNTPQTGDAYARLGAPVGASTSADIAAVKSLLPSALTGAGNMKVDALAINGNTTAAANLAIGAAAVVQGTVSSGSSTTSINTSALTPAATVTGQFIGRTLIFDANTTTAALQGQATTISASTSGGVLTVAALTTAPASGDIFAIY